MKALTSRPLLWASCALLPWITGCQLTPWVSQDPVNAVYQSDWQSEFGIEPRQNYRSDEQTLISTPNQLEQDIDQQVLGLLQTQERGALRIEIQGEPLADALVAHLKQKYAQTLLETDVIVESNGLSGSGVQVYLSTKLQIGTCRYSKVNYRVSSKICETYRNRYVSLVNHDRWVSPAELESDTALDSGAVQRLYDNQIKFAEKQQVTGE